MLSITCIKSWRNQKRSAKNNKNQTFINIYNWEGINYLSEKDNWKEFEKNNVNFVLNVLYTKKEKIYPA